MIIHKVAGDGNCLYNSLAYGILYRDVKPKKPNSKSIKNLAKILRDKMAIAMYKKILGNDKNKTNVIFLMAGSYDDDFNSNLNNGLTNNEILYLKSIKYIEKMSEDKCWGGMIELQFLNEIVKDEYDFRGIVVYDAETKKPFIGMDQKISRKKQLPLLNIVHYENIHYDYVDINVSSIPKNKLDINVS